MSLAVTELVEFLRQSLQVEGSIEVETKLFSSGILDSMAMLQLITFIEESAGVQVSPEEVTLDNFDTVQRIVSLVASKA